MNWEEIRKEYETTSITLKALAEKHGVKLGTLKSRKSREGWNRDATKQKDASKVATLKKDATETTKEEKPVFVEAEGLTDKQRLFCIYYVKSFNQTLAAIKAGYSPDRAHVTGSELVRNRKVADEIRRLKGEMQQGVFVDAMDVLNKYIQIAFADITDYATFGKKEIEVMGPFGPIKDENGNLLTKDVNYVDFKESDMVDGTIVTEVKQGKDGISIKLADKMKALEKLELYFDLLPDKHKRRMEEEKLKLAQLKANNNEQGKQESEVAAMLKAMVNKDGT
ncbi:terminase [Shouchella clausii]|uniref:terminase small subunit n=1 Tax=Shouchella clausii TaxID=79880 RepID=UPI000BA5A0E8|nr:terminase small subunit [Shouchella clausii]PAF13691.1 terminase [Shouchella clausii]